MRVYVRNHFASLRGGSDVLDESKQPVFKVYGKWPSIRKKKRICDLNKNVLYRVRNALFRFHPSAFIFDGDGNKIARVKRKRFTLKSIYIVEGFQDEIKADGNFIARDFVVTRNGEEIGRIKRDVNLVVDSFSVDGEEKDIPFLIALVIAIDNISDKHGR